MRVPEREEKETESIFKAIMVENLPNLKKVMGIQIHDNKET